MNEIAIQRQVGYPKRSGNVWQVALGNSILPPCEGPLSIQGCEFVAVDIPDPLPTCDGEFVPVYTGTNQIIPQAKPSEILSDGRLRFWFHPWVLVDDMFVEDDEILLTNNEEFYKLMPEIDIKCVNEIDEEWVLTFEDSNGNEVIVAQSDESWDIQIFDNEAGAISILQKKCTASCLKPKYLEISYKTNPDQLDFPVDYTYIADAIAYQAASQLPIKICDCQITKGFIFEAQSSYSEIRVNPLTGETIQNAEHGNVYGQMMFTERMSNHAKRYKLRKV